MLSSSEVSSRSLSTSSSENAYANTAEMQVQVEDVVGIMRENVVNVLKRGENLNELEQKAEELHATSETFRQTTKKVSDHYWWQNWKVFAIGGLAIALVLIIIFVGLVGSGYFGDDNAVN